MILEKDKTTYYNEVKELLKNKLFNLSKRNNLLYFKSKSSHFNLTDKSNGQLYLNGQLMQSLVNGSVILNNFFDIVPNVNKLNKIRLRANKFKNTFGYSNLKLAVSHLKWHNGRHAVQTPILFIDVELERLKGQVPVFQLTLNHLSLETNPVLQYFLNNEYGIELQDNYELTETGYTKFLADLHKNVTRQTSYGLKSISNIQQKEDIDASETWAVDACDVILGEFDYKNMNMVKDYDYYIKNSMNSNTFASLYSLEPKKLITEDLQLPLEEQFNVFSSDKTQNETIAYSRTGENFIVQGPPGTGKSQTITNMIADYMARGKKVLFVCEKRVALEVVKRKLDEVGLGKFSCMLSDVEKDRKDLINQLEENYKIATRHKYGKILPMRQSVVNQINNLLTSFPKLRYIHESKEAIEYVVSNPQDSFKKQLDNYVEQQPYVDSSYLNCALNRYTDLYDEFFQINSELIEDFIYGNAHEKMKHTNIARKILEHEFEKKRKHKSIRNLVEEGSKELIFDLVPVWLMNVSTVSEAIPLDFNDFDVVIFDEASQIKVEQAGTVLYRAKQFIAVGDREQLAPTNFFNKKSVEDQEVSVQYGEYELDIDVDAESFLDQANKNVSSLMLQFHYRSKFKELIEFSNRNFYDGKLITVPSKSIQNFNSHNIYDKSLTFDYIPTGVYKDRKNNQEAVHIAYLVKLIKETSNMSVGVVAFSEAQQREIEGEILKLQSEYPEFADLMEDDDTFVKNLENVQGDERDIIIVSICYGYNEYGKMSMNFGPINQQGGDKRLNVVFSRSKKHMVVVSSIKENDIISENRGALMLKDFLSLAENPVSMSDSIHIDCNSVTMKLCEILSEMGLEYDLTVGKTFNIDIVVKQGKEHTLGIFIDFFNYDNKSDVLNQFLIQQNILKKFGWTTCIINPMDIVYNTKMIKKIIKRKIK